MSDHGRRPRARFARFRDAGSAGPDYGASDSPDWREVDWAAATEETAVNGFALRYVQLGSGSGPPVVFVHGLAGCWQHWLENIAVIAQHRRVIAVDLPGFGGSAPPPGDCSITAFARAVDALCDQLATGPVALVGNSMGGQIAVELAILAPARVERLVLVGAAGVSTCDLPRARYRTLVRVLAAIGTTLPMAHRGFVRRPRARHLAFGAIWRHPTRLSLDLLGEISDGTGAPGFKTAMDAIIDHDFRHRLEEMSAPTLVVHGQQDGLVPLRDAYEFARLIPDSRLLILEDTAHMPMIERPTTFNTALREFLGETDVAATLAPASGRTGVERSSVSAGSQMA